MWMYITHFTTWMSNRLTKLLVWLHDIARLILILYCLASVFKTVINTIFLYSFRYNFKIMVTRITRILSCLIIFGIFWWPATDEICAALLYPLGPAYLGTWGHRKRMRRLAASRELGWPAAHKYMAETIKFQIWHLFRLVSKFYCFNIKPNIFVY